MLFFTTSKNIKNWHIKPKCNEYGFKSSKKKHKQNKMLTFCTMTPLNQGVTCSKELRPYAVLLLVA